MPDSMAEYLQADMECEGLLECIHGLKQLDKLVFRTLVESAEPLTVDEVADRVERERSTAYRAIQRLLQTGFVQKEQVNYDQGGYYHVYRPTDPDEVADDMQRMLNDWYAKMGTLIQEFRDKYDEEVPHAEAASSK
ncbi:helix-turn-helix domain-containing protein [Halogeometricum borinquense]|uniref:Helix-turn-helix domain-containing protein n=1 Tax=Halogeometricum borinquense TaxID=60847 RepID=A0A6C0UF64_9EURY|nr:helix-turn-helix domain-containing protein [Halogeometricum borinquense]QIB74094.1 helix-turn-helix domain-containing protein [Halogeometricum borinquense]QIQ76699.1 helix-turn-helix domain-containing protein [Halogeometricum borinquense]